MDQELVDVILQFFEGFASRVQVVVRAITDYGAYGIIWWLIGFALVFGLFIYSGRRRRKRRR